jgi:hypothetical protein
MRAPWGKLGALSQKINPLGAAAAAAAANHNHANHHTQEAVRNGEENASAVTHVEPAPIRARWSFRQTGSRSMKWLASEGKLNGSATTKDGNIRIDISVDECSDLLGEIVMAGNLTPPSKGLPSKLMAPVEVSAKLTTKAFMWALHCLYLDDIVAVCPLLYGSSHVYADSMLQTEFLTVVSAVQSAQLDSDFCLENMWWLFSGSPFPRIVTSSCVESFRGP